VNETLARAQQRSGETVSGSAARRARRAEMRKPGAASESVARRARRAGASETAQRVVGPWKKVTVAHACVNWSVAFASRDLCRTTPRVACTLPHFHLTDLTTSLVAQPASTRSSLLALSLLLTLSASIRLWTPRSAIARLRAHRPGYPRRLVSTRAQLPRALDTPCA
jgi:hypothetical protein